MAQNVYNNALVAIKTTTTATLPTDSVDIDGSTYVDISDDLTQFSVNTSVTPIETFTFGRDFSNVSAGKKSGDVSFQALLDYGGTDGDVRSKLDTVDGNDDKGCTLVFMPTKPADITSITPSATNPQYVFNAKLLNDTPITASAQDQASLVDITMRVDGEIKKFVS